MFRVPLQACIVKNWPITCLNGLCCCWIYFFWTDVSICVQNQRAATDKQGWWLWAFIQLWPGGDGGFKAAEQLLLLVKAIKWQEGKVVWRRWKRKSGLVRMMKMFITGRDMLTSSIGSDRTKWYVWLLILSIPFCPRHLVQYHFVLESYWHLIVASSSMSLH